MHFKALRVGEVVTFNPLLNEEHVGREIDIYPRINVAGADSILTVVKRHTAFGQPTVVLKFESGPCADEELVLPQDMYEDYSEIISSDFLVASNVSSFIAKHLNDAFDPEEEAKRIVKFLGAA